MTSWWQGVTAAGPGREADTEDMLMAKHRATQASRWWLPIMAALLAAAAVVAVVVIRGGQDEGGRSAAAADGDCTALRVTTASSYAPVLQALQQSLIAGPGCVELAVTTADGRAAGDAAAAGADVWIPDDGAWSFHAGRFQAAQGRSGVGTVVAA